MQHGRELMMCCCMAAVRAAALGEAHGGFVQAQHGAVKGRARIAAGVA